MIEIEIDGIKLVVPQDSMVIEAADNAGIPIPRFCYHKKLSIAANCRMCLVEVEKVGKPLPACATPVSQGMRVFTRSARAVEAQKSVMEFLLINHPLDCPICDQGGECELQDISMGYGSDASRFTEGKRAVTDEDLGPLIATDMTRCIQCTRCVRFGQEVAGIRELGVIGRGEHEEIKTYVKHTLRSELSGNIIDLCPVGALTSKPFRFKARAWELTQTPSIAPHDAMGTHVFVHTRRGKVMRVVPRENEQINETWISDRDRFSYLGLESPLRLEHPLIKINGEWHIVDWALALDKIVTGLNEVIHVHGSDQLGALVSPSTTIEEGYLLQKFWRGLGSPHLDHRLQTSDFSDQENLPVYPGFNTTIAALEQKDAILLIGSNIHHELPLFAHRLRNASLQGAKVMVIDAVDYPLNFPITEKICAHPDQIVNELVQIVYALTQDDAQLPEPLTHFFERKVSSKQQAIAQQLKQGKRPYVVLGALALNHPQASLIRWLAGWIAQQIETTCGELTQGANAAGAWLAGVIPHRGAAGEAIDNFGYDTQAMLATKLKGYLLLGIDPGLDCANPQQTVAALKQAEYVIAISSFKTPVLLDVADVILPAAAFAETSGTFVNGEGRWQSFAGSVPPAGEARPVWKILQALGQLFHLNGFDYTSSAEVCSELQARVSQMPLVSESVRLPFPTLNARKTLPLTRLVEWPIYRTDGLVRHAPALQKLKIGRTLGAYLSPSTAKKLGVLENHQIQVTQGQGSAVLDLYIDASIADDCVLIPSGYDETAHLGENFGEIGIYV